MVGTQERIEDGENSSAILHEPETDENLITELFTAVHYGFKSHIQRILEKRREIVNSYDSSGYSCVHWAAKKDDAGLIQTLHENGADLGAITKNGTAMLPIHWAASDGKVNVIRYILMHRQDLNATESNGCSPLVIATQYNQVNAVIFLLQSKADITLKDNNGDTALHWAAYKGHVQLLGLLAYRMPQEIDCPDIFGQGPLHLAALRGNDECVEYLVQEYRADTAKRDNNGLTSLDLTVKKSQLKSEWFLRLYNSRSIFTAIRGIGMQRIRNTPMLTKFICCGYNDKEISAWAWRVVFLSNFFGSLTTMMFALDESMGDLQMLHQFNAIVQVLWWIFFSACLFKRPSFVIDNIKENNGEYSYEKGLETIYESAGIISEDAIPNLCHTCRVRRPLRSKHCKILKCCVNKFDHYCPFVGNTVGRDNYKFFIGLLCTHAIVGLFWEITAVYLWRRTKISWLLFFFMIYSAGWMFMICSLLSYHVQLMLSNMSTNEHINASKYTYFRNSYNIFDNPFDKGSKLANILDSLFPSEKLVYSRSDIDSEV